MATAGSGDVLTGILTGLVSQTYNPIKAAIFGVYLHGKAGDIALPNFGYQALTASDIVDHIGDAYLDLFTAPEKEKVKEPEEPKKQKTRKVQQARRKR